MLGSCNSCKLEILDLFLWLHHGRKKNCQRESMLFKRWGEICQDISEYSLVNWLFKLVPIVYSSVEGTFSFRKLKSQSRSRTVLTKEVGFSVSFFRMLTFIGYFMKDFKSIIIGRFYCWHRIDVSLICASLVQICKAWQILDFGDLRYLWFFLFCYYFLKNLSRQGIYGMCYFTNHLPRHWQWEL